MKISILALLFIPFLSFGQVEVETELSKKEKKKIERYAIDLCDCMTDVMSVLHPKAIDVIQLVAKNGEESAMTEIQEIVGDLGEDEQQAFMESLEKMDDPVFLERMDKCDVSESMGEELKAEIDSMEGEAYDYLVTFFSGEENCSLVKSLLDLANSMD